jgi:hypothetical protein
MRAMNDENAGMLAKKADFATVLLKALFNDPITKKWADAAAQINYPIIEKWAEKWAIVSKQVLSGFISCFNSPGFRRMVEDLQSGRWLMNLIIETADEALVESGHLDNLNKKQLKAARDIFAENMSLIVQAKDTDMVDKQCALNAIRDAMAIGSIAGNSKILESWGAKVRKEVMNPAHDARRKDAIQEIIERNAANLWLKKEGFSSKPSATAREICVAVRAEIDELYKDSNPPKGWEPADKKIDIERIRKRLSRALSTNKSDIGQVSG